tara:strand:- start:729 stop:1016 length:288 start_codon:yes stop_codon:yes gene_type:complete
MSKLNILKDKNGDAITPQLARFKRGYEDVIVLIINSSCVDFEFIVMSDPKTVHFDKYGAYSLDSSFLRYCIPISDEYTIEISNKNLKNNAWGRGF